MTHLIDTWQKTESVFALQTTNTLEGLPLDLHPRQSNPKQLLQLQRTFKLPHEPMFLSQVHQSGVHEYLRQPSTNLTIQADACFTRKPHVICAILTADCLPVLLTDSAGTFVAAVHCGWRSLFDNILSKTIAAVNSSHQVLAWFGPCIQQAQYEVDKSFVENYLKQHPDTESAFTPIKQHKSFANLYHLAEMQLRQATKAQISFDNECTFTDSSYYSWRENRTPKRMASMAWLNPH